ncbi:hypothetical protein V1525DRAFT_28207 [Lipomyces kononenkoae]|uniref:Uncharacterized protein n=1 Tax=Lipomyces kononenkoae TaxID=34357 RepID=A0ACC3T7G1_LIPKO
MDIESVFNFCQINLRARQMVCAVRGYQTTINHALAAICATLRTKIAKWFTLHELFDVLCTRDCHLCGGFGGFIFLPLFMRCCLPCVQTAPQLVQVRHDFPTQFASRFKFRVRGGYRS